MAILGTIASQRTQGAENKSSNPSPTMSLHLQTTDPKLITYEEASR